MKSFIQWNGRFVFAHVVNLGDDEGLVLCNMMRKIGIKFTRGELSQSSWLSLIHIDAQRSRAILTVEFL